MLDHDLHSDARALLPGSTTEAGPTRRTALQVALGVGYAAAAAPVMAQTAIATPADGLTAGEVSFMVNGFKVPAYRAAPAGNPGGAGDACGGAGGQGRRIARHQRYFRPVQR